MVQELVDAGEITSDEAADHPERHVITRALGGPGLAEADYFLLPLPAVERLLLCTDGVSGLIDDDRDRRDPGARPPTRATPPTGWSRPPSTPAGGTTPPRSSSMWWDWSPSDAYDSERQRASLEEKLGALP